MADVFGKALLRYLNGDPTPYIIERDDGFLGIEDIRIYFTGYSEWKEFEKEVLKFVRGRMLDLGAGAGRHALYFQDRGLEVHALDISPNAIAVMFKRGVKNIHLADLRKLDFPKNYFDSILMMYNNFGLAGSVKGTKRLLGVLSKVSTEEGRVITTIRDPYKTDRPEHLDYHERNRKVRKPAGLVRLRMRYKGEIGDWFDLLTVSPEELGDLIPDTGWKILNITEGPNGIYGAVLEKER